MSVYGIPRIREVEYRRVELRTLRGPCSYWFVVTVTVVISYFPAGIVGDHINSIEVSDCELTRLLRWSSTRTKPDHTHRRI